MAHSSMDGAGHCTDCHDSGKRPPEFKCLSCHREIRERLDSGKGWHPSLVGSDRTGRSCAKCHNEHNGRNFDLIHWSVPIQQFDHSKTGYRLEGRHAALACRTCHQASHIPSANRTNLLDKSLTRTYLGLSRECTDCHADAHHAQLSMNCGSCHDSQDWKKPVRFDHGKARFSIEGAHEKIACVRCHVESGSPKPIPQYRNLEFEDCTPCHHDPHSGSFRNPCRTCHSLQNATWKPSNSSANFDHSRTRFALRGKHALLSCRDCHARGNFAQKIAFDKCSDCHKPDPHGGQFSSETPARDCDFCHSFTAFKPSTFGIARHNETRFPLEESHIKAPCVKCHTPNAAKAVVYRIADFSCINCHQDVHGSQFAAAPYSNRCEECHTDKEFKPSTFTIARHDATRFPLAGSHAKAACEKCHSPNVKPVPFRFEDRSCTQCHADPHESKFSVRTATLVFEKKEHDSCDSCHTVNNWHELKNFDHSQTRFALEGAHRTVGCTKCHKPAGTASDQTLLFSDAAKQCTGCHEDPHQAQFASRMAVLLEDGNPVGCSSCHSAVSWHELPGFDHSATQFPLLGAHRTATCEKCHKAPNPKEGVRGIDYIKTPVRCSSCHEDIHAGQFDSDANSANCAQCHGMEKWKPSTFDHNTQSSYRLTGAHREVSCGLCHSKTKEVAGKKVAVYRGTARECSACHQTDDDSGNEL